MWQYQAVIERVVDGDTIDVRLDLGFDVWTRQRLRLLDIDTPETRGPTRLEGLDAMMATERLLPNDTPVVVETEKDDAFGRYLARVITPDGIDVGERLLADGHATRWDRTTT